MAEPDPRSASILRAIARNGPLSAANLKNRLRASERTTGRLLADLVDSGRLEKVFYGRGVKNSRIYRYAIKESVEFPTIGAGEYVFWHPTGSLPETIAAVERPIPQP